MSVRVMLTSFSVGKYPSVFNRLPPLDIRMPAEDPRPEYSLLVLCDKFVLDKVSFDLLMDRPGTLFKSTARMTKLLYDEGYLELADYSSIIHDNNQLLHRMTQNDLESAVQWFDALKNSAIAWQEFTDRAKWPYAVDWEFNRTLKPESLLRDSFWPKTQVHNSARVKPRLLDQLAPFDHVELYGHSSAQNSDFSPAKERSFIVRPRVRREETDAALHHVLISYLDYVNTNLILSRKLDAGLYDWVDFLPFYQRKFLSVGHENTPVFGVAETSHQLFDIAFPEFSIQSPEHLIRLLKHRRVGELRTLIREASEGRVAFDKDFARSVYREVFEINEERMWRRRLIGYATLPISFIPLMGNFAQPAVQEVAGMLAEGQLTKPYRWFYMIRDIARKERSNIKWQKFIRSRRKRAEP
jgi:hypothetical protein